MAKELSVIIGMTLLTKQEDVDSETTISTFTTTHSGIWEYLYKRDFSGGIQSKVEIKIDTNGPDEAKVYIKAIADLIKNLPRSGESVNGVKIDCDVG
jgi:hypothetical protein